MMRIKSWPPLAALLLAGITGCACVATPGGADFALQRGDLLFQDLDCGPLCDAIETVTRGVDGAHFSHVGMVVNTSGPEPLIIEAVSAGVVETPLSQFLSRSDDSKGRPKVLAGRLDRAHQPLVDQAIRTAEGFLGLPYDSIYVMDNSSFYCSELVYEAFRVANGGQPVFSLAPMTFKDPNTGETFPPWSEYYRQLGVPIPEGEPGLNPGSISRSPLVRIVHAYGRPTGWRGHVERRP